VTVASGVTVRGLREISASFAALGGEARKEFRAEERAIAEPVRRDAETLAVQRIRRIGPRWSKMRIGVNQNVVYVAPRQRGVKTKGRQQLARPNLANLLMDRAMEPALRQNTPRIEHDLERLLDRVCDRFNKGGI
jgi:hypothetical protein